MAVPVSDLPTLSLLYKLNKIDTTPKGTHTQTYTPNASYNDRISIIRQDITTLSTDAIVNAANNTLLGGGGVDGAIHRVAGPDLLAECETLAGCRTGSAKITDGYELPARKVIHAVGPVYFSTTPARAAGLLAGCYTTSLQLAVQNGCRSIAFAALSTGVYGYPSEDASVVALAAVRQFFEEGKGADTLERVVFCNFLEKDERAYFDALPAFFPPVSDATTSPAPNLDESILTDTNADDSTGEHTTEVFSQLPDADADAGFDTDDEAPEILSQLPDAPTTDPVDPPEASGPESKKQKTAEDPDTDEGFVIVDKNENGDAKKKEL